MKILNSMKLIQTKDYLLLINTEAEIKEGDIAIHDFGMGYDLEIPCDVDNLKSNTRKLVVAYYPLTEEAKELDLPLLPNPFENETHIKELAQQSWGNVHRTGVLGFIEGYKAAQSDKQFSLEDMIKAFNTGKKHIYKCEANGKDKKCYCRNDNDCNQRSYMTAEEYVQSLSTQQLPKEFEPLIEIYDFDHGVGRSCIPRKILKTVANSENKEVLVGTYKY